MPQLPQPLAIVVPLDGKVGEITTSEQLASLLESDPRAEIFGGRHPAVYLADRDAWFTLRRKFSLFDYLAEDYAHLTQGDTGRRFWEHERADRQPVGLCLPVNGSYSARRNYARAPRSRQDLRRSQRQLRPPQPRSASVTDAGGSNQGRSPAGTVTPAELRDLGMRKNDAGPPVTAAFGSRPTAGAASREKA